MSPKCPHCQSDKGFDRTEILPNPEKEKEDPVCDVVFCRNCGTVITALIPYHLQLDIERYILKEISRA